MLRQIVISIGALRISKDFIIKYRLWDKWQSMRWIYTTFAVLAIALGFKMLGLIADGISNLGHIVTGDFDQVHLGLTGGAFLSDWNFTNSGFYNYVFLFLVMSFVFHFGGRALRFCTASLIDPPSGFCQITNQNCHSSLYLFYFGASVDWSELGSLKYHGWCLVKVVSKVFNPKFFIWSYHHRWLA